MSESKYARQAAYNRKNYVRFPLDLKPDVLAAFRSACEKNNTKPKDSSTSISKVINKITPKAQAFGVILFPRFPHKKHPVSRVPSVSYSSF